MVLLSGSFVENIVRSFHPIKKYFYNRGVSLTLRPLLLIASCVLKDLLYNLFIDPTMLLLILFVILVVCRVPLVVRAANTSQLRLLRRTRLIIQILRR